MATKSRKTKAVEVDTASPEAEAAPVHQTDGHFGEGRFENRDVGALRNEKGVCALIRAVTLAHPTLPKAAFVAAGTKIGLHPATVGIQRARALRKQGET